MAFIGLSAVAASGINTTDDMASSDMQAITIDDADDMDFDDDDYSCRQYCFGDNSDYDQIMQFFDFDVKNINDLDFLKIYYFFYFYLNFN